MTVRPATAEDIRAFHPKMGPTARAWAGVMDGEVVALGGVVRGGDGRWYAFFDLKDKARRAKKTIVKSTRDFFESLNVKYVYAMIDEREKNARAWTERIGFRQDPHSKQFVRWEKNKP